MAFLQPDRVYTAYGVTVKQYYLTQHNPNNIAMPQKRTKPLIGITLHNTGDISQAKGTTDAEQYTRATVNGNMGTVRVHFYVDAVEAWQNLPLDWQGWHAGQSGKKDRNGSEAGNAQTISIECIMSGKGDEADKKAEDNAARLIAYLLDTYGMDANENLYTHNYWCNIRNGKKGTVYELNRLDDGYKMCPIYIRKHWTDFMLKVKGYMKPVEKPKARYFVQVGAFADKQAAEYYLNSVKKYYPDAFIKIID
ncbi:peptidoglycan recognition family protein [Ruminococcus sp.]|uniref:peptidoglycan recognition protein family protein n=1 Tax=Ruminococcus sp. TaxID=41978 RepID=UPI001B5E3061|nr:peptidoglycan recognition family protein [Ruminococcus sp.]MBP5433061.1 N-acetylmuramoyl-L-alanine amidase [Ruminococcus sp.]